mmetsp:Transcript_5289/g.12554  ORF Transcript_5289/g.12554 Transcript_5289/m.12554 type:complete len:93 (-) Transcript_5289:1444-1722(-)
MYIIDYHTLCVNPFADDIFYINIVVYYILYVNNAGDHTFYVLFSGATPDFILYKHLDYLYGHGFCGSGNTAPNKVQQYLQRLHWLHFLRRVP